MPTFFLFKNGEKVDELVGANPAGLNVRIPFSKLGTQKVMNWLGLHNLFREIESYRESQVNEALVQ